MGLAAVKYADLSMNRESNYRFSFNKMLGAVCFTITKVLALLVQKHADFSMNRESTYVSDAHNTRTDQSYSEPQSAAA